MAADPQLMPQASVPILLVDDRAENRLALRAIVSRPDYEIVETASGAQALRALLDREFALLLVDVIMPGMSGFELATAVRQRARTSTIPIVFLTAESTDVEPLYQAYRLGAVDYLVKPLVPEVVRAKVAVFAELYRQRKRLEEQSERLVEAERRESELKLLELRLATERRFHGLADAVPHVLWTARADGTVDYLNLRWFEYTGVSIERTRGDWISVVDPADAPACRDRWRAALADGRRFEAECRVRRADGAVRWNLCRAVPQPGPSGEIASWIGTFTDVDETKRLEASLAEFRATLDAVLDPVVIFDADSLEILYANEGASLLLAHPAEALVRGHPRDFMSEFDEARLRELIAPLRDGDRPTRTLETRYRRSDGNEVPVDLLLQYIPGDAPRLVAIARDITERKRGEAERERLYREALEAIGARDEFLSVASHELRMPLSALQLQIGMQLRASRATGGERAASPANFERSLRQVERLSRLVDELLDVARIQSGRFSLQLEEVDLAHLARDVAARFGGEAAAVPIEVVAPDPVVGRWDRLRLEQVLTNLLANALKYGAGNPVDVRVEDAGETARLAVQDRGIGIAPADLERVFERFERAVSSRAYGGLGLGLYIVRRIVDAHGGTIGLESELGAGSTFTVELPTQPAATVGEPRPRERPGRSGDARQGGAHLGP